MIPASPANSIIPWHLPTPDPLVEDAAYQGALRRIYAFSEARRSPDAIALGRARKLDRMRALLGLLGLPQARFDTVLVAGTKGKGSMAAALAAILTEAGYRVGRYTQPHLYSYRERTWVAGCAVAPADIVAGLEAMSPALAVVDARAAELGPLTTFDVGTALSLAHFARAGVELAVVEVGVGGAADATNALEPIASLIGPVGMDHQATLGPDLASIAREKAGVARAGVPLVVGRQEPEALAVIAERAADVGARMLALGKDFWSDDASPEGELELVGPLGTLRGLTPALQGEFQRDNMTVAAAAALALRQSDWSIPDAAIRDGLSRVEWPGRFQTVIADPLTVVDGAHNASAARALGRSLSATLGNRRITLVLGMAEDKDAPAFIAELAPFVERAIVTRARHVRSTDPARLAEFIAGAGIPCEVVPLPADAVRRAWSGLPSTGAVLVTGSLFLVGDVMEWLLTAAVPEPEVVG